MAKNVSNAGRVVPRDQVGDGADPLSRNSEPEPTDHAESPIARRRNPRPTAIIGCVISFCPSSLVPNAHAEVAMAPRQSASPVHKHALRDSHVFRDLDRDLAAHAGVLTSELSIDDSACGRVASILANEMASLGAGILEILADGEPVDFKLRCDELSACHGFENATRSLNVPEVVRFRALVQNYMCSVYIKEAWLDRLRASAPPNSVLRACTAYLTTGKVRAFRNAMSHARWQHMADFRIVYWDRAQPSKAMPLLTYGVAANELKFWQTLTWVVASVAVSVGFEARRVSRSSTH